jgi:phage FluMu protein Com
MITINNRPYRELRCKTCRKLICYEYVFAGRVAFGCPRCSELNEITFRHMPTKENIATIDNEFTSLGNQKEVKQNV